MKKEKIYPALLLVLATVMVYLSYVPGSLYGSSCDWFAQHVSIAETMRRTILEEGTLFPGQLPLGGGSNIYDFSYYGYLRPDVLLACLMPGVAMEYIITGYSVAEYICSVLLFYIFLRKRRATEDLALLGGILFLCAGCFFQIHRQIMFVNYMPFLLGALLCVLRYHKTGKSALLILMLFLIELHSYYYAISCLLVIYLFLLYTAEWTPGGAHMRQLWSLTWRYALKVLASVAMAALLLLPTASSILHCASAKDGGSASRNPWEFQWDFGSLLYNGYGLGLTLVILFLLLLSLWRKQSRLLAAFVLFCLVCGLVPLALNGFLYNRAKILMPFLPLVLLLCLETLQQFWEQKRKPNPLILIPVAGAAYLQYKTHGEIWVWLDLMFVLAVFGLLFIRRRLTAALRVTLTAMCALVFFFAAALHRNETMITQENAAVSSFSEEERRAFYKDTAWRFDTFINPYQTGNRLLAYGAGRTSMYTSTANAQYSAFFYDEIKNPIGSNNRVGLFDRANPFFLYLMGVRYLECTKSTLPVGYEIRQQKGDAVLAEREDVLPLCCGSTSLLSREAYEQLEFPENLEALVSKSIVETAKGTETETAAEAENTEEFTSHFRKLQLTEGVDYEIRLRSEEDFAVIPKKPIENQLLAVSFQVKAKSRAAVVITVNGVTNKLSGASAPYPNHNETFTYLLSGTEPITEFQVKTSGSYEIRELQIYSLDAAYLGSRTVYPLKPLEADGEEKEEAGRLKQSGKGKCVISGTITMPKDGYLVTSYPMQEGYQAYVDGEFRQAEVVNEAFVGLPLAAGAHEILLFYEPPLQKAGMLISAAGWLIWLWIFCDAGSIVFGIIKKREGKRRICG